MFSFTLRTVLSAAAVTLLASGPVLAALPSSTTDQGYTLLAPSAGNASDKGVSAQYASRAGDREDGAAADTAQYASRAGDREDGAAADTAQYASRAGDREDGAAADTAQYASRAGDREDGAAVETA